MGVLSVVEQCAGQGRSAAASVVLWAHQRLRAAGNQGLWNVQCQWKDGTLVLHGIVPTYYLKQLAQSLFIAEPAIERVENRIVVS